MNGLPYYKAYPRDFLDGTAGMPFELKGTYRLILDLIYYQGGSLPDDPQYIAGNLGMSVRKWNSLRAQLIERGKITADHGIISNFRADKELIISRSLQDKQAENRRGYRKNKDLQKPKVNHTDTDTYKREAKASPKNTPAQILTPLLGKELAGEVVAHRQRLRKSMTPKAAELMLREFQNCPDPVAGAEMMIARGWQGFKADWFNREKTSNGKGKSDDKRNRIFQMADRLDGRAPPDSDMDSGADHGATLPLLPAGHSRGH